MAGKNRVQLAKEALKAHQGQEMFLEPLKALIELKLSSSSKMVLEYLRLMRTQGLIKEVPTDKQGVTKWKVL